MSRDKPALCWLHEDNEPEHWVPETDIVGVVTLVDGDLRPDLGLSQAARSCAEKLGQPERIVEESGRR